MWNPDFEVQNVTCCCNQFQHKLPGHCFVQGHVAAGLEEFRSFLQTSSSIAVAIAASTSCLAGTIGRPGLEPLLMSGSNDIGFLTLCMW